MIFIACILCPPIIPFVIVYYLCKGRNYNRRNALALERIADVIAPRPEPQRVGLFGVAVTIMLALCAYGFFSGHAMW